MTDNNSHGGARKGAGRPAKYASMKAMKVPTDYIPVIKALIQHLNDTDMIGFDSNDKPVKTTIETVFRSKQDKKQSISFVTSPFKPSNQIDLVDLLNAIDND